MLRIPENLCERLAWWCRRARRALRLSNETEEVGR
jgi:hypothetical protein